jgi:anthranilate/para-aminobenzoate synthase component II
MLLVIDNYDSFTYNLVQYLGELGADVLVRRNDAVTVDEVGELAPEGIVLSPGPCAPAQAGVTVDVIAPGADDARSSACASAIRRSARRTAAASCARSTAVHGKTSRISHDGRPLRRTAVTTSVGAITPSRSNGPRFPSRCASSPRRSTTSRRSTPFATDASGVGVQFHPESVLTPTASSCCATSSVWSRVRGRLLAALLAPSLLGAQEVVLRRSRVPILSHRSCDTLRRSRTCCAPDAGSSCSRATASSRRNLLVIGHQTYLSSRVHGDVVVVGGVSVSCEPGRRVSGARRVAIGGSVYRTFLGTVGGSIESYRDDHYSVRREPVALRAVVPGPRQGDRPAGRAAGGLVRNPSFPPTTPWTD